MNNEFNEERFKFWPPCEQETQQEEEKQHFRDALTSHFPFLWQNERWNENAEKSKESKTKSRDADDFDKPIQVLPEEDDRHKELEIKHEEERRSERSVHNVVIWNRAKCNCNEYNTHNACYTFQNKSPCRSKDPNSLPPTQIEIKHNENKDSLYVHDGNERPGVRIANCSLWNRGEIPNKSSLEIVKCVRQDAYRD